ncbi:MAG TPA: hypothetical protein VGV35_18605, partial [Bryobacteraceae bacterium]|nr:hypothetical protein [Bryobacteraceae bacterium]
MSLLSLHFFASRDDFPLCVKKPGRSPAAGKNACPTRVLSRILIGLALAASLIAQTEPFFPKPSYFKRHFANTATRVELQPPVRLSDFVAGGTLELSLRNYIDLVMANNPDITI